MSLVILPARTLGQQSPTTTRPLQGAHLTVPEIIHTLTIQLAAGLLLQNAYRGTDRGKDKLKAARDLIHALQVGDQTITDDDGQVITSGEGISFWPDEDAPRAFHMGDRF
ncbi:hypothetical protein BHQ19_32335 [Mycolicibacterium porcinum]|nr:hypothetical protein BHQ19_32335 [Mycolicibacterium porcinum]